MEGLSLINPPLRVGLLLDSFQVDRWIAQVVREIRGSGVAEIALVVLNAPAETAGGARRLGRHAFYALYMRLDGWMFGRPGDAFEPTDLTDVLAHCPTLQIRPVEVGAGERVAAADVEAIRACHLDVALRLGFGTPAGSALGIARYGIWSYRHGDHDLTRERAAGCWEVLDGDPITGSVLEVLNEELDRGRMLYRSFARTDSRSVRRNRNNYFSTASSFVVRKLRDLYEDGPAALPLDREDDRRPPVVRKAPTNAQMVRGLSRLAGRFLHDTLQNVSHFEQWTVAFSFRKASQLSQNLQFLLPPADRFWADPFPVRHAGRYFVFLEESLFAEGKGRIAVTEVTADGAVGSPVTVLERPYHLSYPSIFEWRGSYFMVPETEGAGRIELYRCTSFPGEWQVEGVLLDDVHAFDSTIACVDGRWWMFTAIRAAGATSEDELFLFYADSPLGPWTAHRRNPVRSDVRAARPAGRLFERDGEWYRPAQDGSGRYGRAVAVQKVLRMDTHEYLEEEAWRIDLSWDPDVKGVHTFNTAGALTVIDCRLRRPRYPVVFGTARSSTSPRSWPRI